MNDFMDRGAKECLDIGYILNKLDVNTPYGQTYKVKLKPYIRGQEEELKDELNRIEMFIELIENERSLIINMRNIFAHMKDLRHSISRCVESYVLTEVEIFEIKNFIILIRELKEELLKAAVTLWDDMSIQPIFELEQLFDPRNERLKTFYIYDEYSEELSSIREEKKIVEKRIKQEKKELREKISRELGLRVGPDNTVTIEKTDKELIGKVEEYPILTYNCETYMNIKYSLKSTEGIDCLEKEMEFIKSREENEEFKIRSMLSKEITNHSGSILRNMESIGKIDLIMAKAYMAVNIDGVKPIIKKDHEIEIIEGRHLRVEETLMKKSQDFIPISVNLKDGVTCITGANMGGKTVSLKLIGMLAAMTQYGLFPPCEKIETGLHDFIHISIGDWQSADQGLSTFGAEIKGIQQAISRIDEKGLILIDELARGTNPEEGYAISKAIVDYLDKRSCITVITTHYDNLADGEGIVHLQVVGLANVDYEKLKEELKNNKNHGIDIVTHYMDYRLKEVDDKSQVPRDAINVARLMGLNEDVIREAEKELERR